MRSSAGERTPNLDRNVVYADFQGADGSAAPRDRGADRGSSPSDAGPSSGECSHAEYAARVTVDTVALEVKVASNHSFAFVALHVDGVRMDDASVQVRTDLPAPLNIQWTWPVGADKMAAVNQVVFGGRFEHTDENTWTKVTWTKGSGAVCGNPGS